MVIDNELLAAYAEGNVSPEERKAVRQYLAANPNMMESVLFAMGMTAYEKSDKDGNLRDTEHPRVNQYIENLGTMVEEIEGNTHKHFCVSHTPSVLPMTAMAAQNTIDNLCAIKCEGIALRALGYDVTDEQLLRESEQEGWLQSTGTALHNIGCLAGARGLSVSHRYHCKIKDIQEALSVGNIVIAAIDGNELQCDYEKERQKDATEGLTPNHVVIVSEIKDCCAIITDSATPSQRDVYPLSQFIDAWNDSSNYLILISNNDDYIPHPINLDDVEVEEDLLELREAIAENAHEVWAENRRKEGWTYGPERDDAKKHHPDMLPYSRLPESEKEYDRIMAMNTIKLLKKLGWKLTKSKQ